VIHSLCCLYLKNQGDNTMGFSFSLSPLGIKIGGGKSSPPPAAPTVNNSYTTIQHILQSPPGFGERMDLNDYDKKVKTPEDALALQFFTLTNSLNRLMASPQNTSAPTASGQPKPQEAGFALNDASVDIMQDMLVTGLNALINLRHSQQVNQWFDGFNKQYSSSPLTNNQNLASQSISNSGISGLGAFPSYPKQIGAGIGSGIGFGLF
jgi:hypothetical protein